MTRYISLNTVEYITIEEVEQGFVVNVKTNSGVIYSNNYISPYEHTLIERLTALQGFIEVQE